MTVQAVSCCCYSRIITTLWTFCRFAVGVPSPEHVFDPSRHGAGPFSIAWPSRGSWYKLCQRRFALSDCCQRRSGRWELIPGRYVCPRRLPSASDVACCDLLRDLRLLQTHCRYNEPGICRAPACGLPSTIATHPPHRKHAGTLLPRPLRALSQSCSRLTCFVDKHVEPAGTRYIF